MKISVCMATYNGERFVEKQLQTIREQTRPVDEVIICDDGSTDSTRAICESFIRKYALHNWKFYENETNLGFCLNFFGAIEKASGDLIFLADQDDEWFPQKVARMEEVFREHPEVTVLSSRYDVIDEQSGVLEHSGVTYLGNRFDGSLEFLSADSFITCSYIRGFATAFRASLKTVLKPMELKSMLAHDWLINILGAICGKTAVLNEKLVGYRYHRDNVSLADMTRTSLIGDPGKRIAGLKESIAAHSFLAQADFVQDEKLRQKLKKAARFEIERLRFLERKNPLIWLKLAFSLSSYRRYYRSFSGGIRVWLGDFCYAYRVNFKTRSRLNPKA